MRRSFPLALFVPLAVVTGACSDSVTVPRTAAIGGPRAALGLVSGSTYYLHNACSGKVLDVTGVSTSDGALIQIWTKGSGTNQQWKLTTNSDGSYQILSVNSGKALDVKDQGTTNGTRVQQWAPSGGANQRWLVTDLGTGYAKMAPASAPGEMLDVTGAGTADGTPVQIWADNGGGCSQQWQFEAVGATTVTPTPAPASGTAQVWVTTGDQSKLLSQGADIAMTADAATSLPALAVDTTTTYQSMIGFGAAFTDATTYLINEKLSSTARASLLQELYGRTNGGLGFSFGRVPMGATDFSSSFYTYDDMPSGQTDQSLANFSIAPDLTDKLPVIKQALSINPALKLVATPWSPPAWMKTTGTLTGAGGGTLRSDVYSAFGNYFVKFVQAYQGQGVPVFALTVQNEPGNAPGGYPGMLLDPNTRATVIGQNVGPALAAAGLSTQIWDYDHNWDTPSSPLTVLGNATANRYVSGVAWHCYAGSPSAQTTVHNAYPSKDQHFTECSGGDWSPDFATNLRYNVDSIVIGATRNWARSVALWNLALDQNHGPYLGGCSNCRGVLTINNSTGAITRNVEYYALGHGSRFVHPGAVRVASTSGVSGLTSVAFRNTDDGSKALIVLNENTGSAQTFVVRPGGGRAFQYSLPASSVATFVWK